jgi:hypothetical protein
MSTITLHYPNAICVRRAPKIGLILILILTSLVLIAGAILVIVLSPTRDAYRADSIPVADTSPYSLPVAGAVPTPPSVEIQLSLTEKPALSAGVVSEPSVVPVPVPTPPST